jgi:hypothetical protein
MIGLILTEIMNLNVNIYLIFKCKSVDARRHQK